ncbi:MAG TPA: response regulator transcription factor [Gaiellaceae bacterium]
MPVSVVIVDDHAGFRAAARRLLELEGFEVVGEAADGASGLALVSELAPELVLLDVSLPDASGFDIAAALAPSEATVVLTSSRGLRDLGRRVERCGAAGFVPKDRLSGAALSELLVA